MKAASALFLMFAAFTFITCAPYVALLAVDPTVGISMIGASLVCFIGLIWCCAWIAPKNAGAPINVWNREKFAKCRDCGKMTKLDECTQFSDFTIQCPLCVLKTEKAS